MAAALPPTSRGQCELVGGLSESGEIAIRGAPGAVFPRPWGIRGRDGQHVPVRGPRSYHELSGMRHEVSSQGDELIDSKDELTRIRGRGFDVGDST